jgi:MOSC domain-containing protein YiiM
LAKPSGISYPVTVNSTDAEGRTPMMVISLNVGLPATLRYGGKDVVTGGSKRPVPRAALRFLGFEGDGQGDPVNHGGKDKAVCVYPFDHYPHWERALGRGLEPGAFSENLTVSGAVETEVAIGDVFRVGGATVQVSQPRTPCDKLAEKNGERLLAKWVGQTGYTGFYLRVLSEGVVAAGDAFERVGRCQDPISIAWADDVIFDRTDAPDLVERLANLIEFGADGRALFARRLERMRRRGGAGRAVRTGEDVPWA